MGLWNDQLLPRLVHRAMGTRTFQSWRPRCVSSARGRVLEIGFGSGLNLPHYGSEVRELLAVEPSATARRLAAAAIERARFPVLWAGLDGSRLEIEDSSVDTVVSTWTLCTIPDVTRALLESRRVLAPGGRLLLLEHGRSDNARVAGWQRRANPVQGFLCGGCQLDRPIPELVRSAGFEFDRLDCFKLPGPRVWSTSFLGSAYPDFES